MNLNQLFNEKPDRLFLDKKTGCEFSGEALIKRFSEAEEGSIQLSLQVKVDRSTGELKLRKACGFIYIGLSSSSFTSRYKIRAVIKIENIARVSKKDRGWVSEILGIDKKYGFNRKFLKPNTDWRLSNSKGTRGIYLYYFVEDRSFYEVCSPISWKQDDRYFCTAKDGEIIRLRKEELICKLKYI